MLKCCGTAHHHDHSGSGEALRITGSEPAAPGVDWDLAWTPLGLLWVGGLLPSTVCLVRDVTLSLTGPLQELPSRVPHMADVCCFEQSLFVSQSLCHTPGLQPWTKALKHTIVKTAGSKPGKAVVLESEVKVKRWCLRFK